jgi:hypothetical protein
MKDKDSKEAKHLLATIGSLTGSGGRATTAKEGFALRNLGVARVGDNGTYRDRSEAVIADGVGFALVIGDRLTELVGGSPSNSDRITKIIQGDDGLLVCDGKRIPRLFNPACMPPQCTDANRGHNHA